MRKITRHKLHNTNKNKKMIEVMKVTGDKYITDNWRYRKVMCKDCIHLVNNECSKKRILRICAEKGLKNR